MGLIDKIAKKILGEEEEYSLRASLDSMDGCVGESTIAKIKNALKKLIPC